MASFKGPLLVFCDVAVKPAGPLQLQAMFVPPVLLAVRFNTSFSQIGFGLAVAVRVVMGSCNVNVPEVKAAVHELVLVTVTVNGPAADTVPVAALLGLTPADHA